MNKLGRQDLTEINGQVVRLKKFEKVVMFEVLTKDNQKWRFKSFNQEIINGLDENDLIRVINFRCMNAKNKQGLWEFSLILEGAEIEKAAPIEPVNWDDLGSN